MTAAQLEADGVTIATITAERDAAQASKESYRDAMSSICFTLAVGSGDETTTADEYQRRIEQGIAFLTDPMALRIEGLQAEIARVTAALATPDQIAALAAKVDASQAPNPAVNEGSCQSDTIAKSDDFVSLPSAEVEALMELLRRAKHCIGDNYLHWQGESDVALATLQGRMK